MLRGHGVTVIEADRVGHEVLEPHGPAFDEVAARWPSAVVDGRIDRRTLGRIVFADPTELSALEAITHPHIRRRVAEGIDGAPDTVAVEVPIPVAWLDPTWPRVVVDVPDPIRIERLLERGMTRGEIHQRMAAQPTRHEWLELADHVIDNSGGADDLEPQVEALLSTLDVRR